MQHQDIVMLAWRSFRQVVGVREQSLNNLKMAYGENQICGLFELFTNVFGFSDELSSLLYGRQRYRLYSTSYGLWDPGNRG